MKGFNERSDGWEPDEFTRQVTLRIRNLLRERGLTVADLARRCNMSRSNVSQYLRIGEPNVRYREWPAGLVLKVATALGVLPQTLIGDNRDKNRLISDTPGTIWNPASDDAAKALAGIGEHDERANDGIGFFRVPPCPILLPTMSTQIMRNKFGFLEEFGARIIAAYEEIEAYYRLDYAQCGGRYKDFELLSLIFESDVKQLIQGEGIYTGCERSASHWLNELLRTHVKRMNYKLGIVADHKIPREIYYHLLNADSLILVGHTASVHRGISDFKITVRTSGPLFRLDQQYLRALAHSYADFSLTGMTTKIEMFKRKADFMSKRVRHFEP